MPKYIIGGNYGYAGTDWEDKIETASIEEAAEIAWVIATERVTSWAEEIEEEE